MSETREPPTATVLEASRAVYRDIIQQFTNATANASSPLQALQAQIDAIFKHGPDRAGDIYNELVGDAWGNDTLVLCPVEDMPVGWSSCRNTATLVSLLACPEQSLEHTVRSSPMYGESAPLGEIVNTESASLRDAYREAKTAAASGRTTVMVGTLEDVQYHRLLQQSAYLSFAYCLALGIRPEGAIVWQSWASRHHQYCFDEYLARSGATLKTFVEMDTFVDQFEDLAQHKGVWDGRCNDLYRKLFHVDIMHVCETTDAPPITPRYEPLVMIRGFNDVRMQHLQKFRFVDHLDDEV
ncbi:hypothetical protein LTR78_006526 [Recurvomyces mirabilis]|uniref:Uncharacterized protein n=1 Tax=Recurvomyces mirabilis TaxID=574656 RepID=A0AAE0WKX3_9PEZI|nr:hypothetical protein LTR78_006526 [Recurvomyces mirabilis]KAK5151056.1 hypothetical protein LTS14_009551 [Recurvomyces mirabilis]